MPKHTRTVCMEFFGQARDAIPSIVEVKGYLDGEGRERGAILAGLEHLDERYLRAVGCATKSKRGVLPKMVLIGDIVGDDEDAVAAAASEVVRLANTRHGEGFVAVSAEARKKSGSTVRAPPPSRATPTRRARNSGSTVRAPPPSRATPTPSRSTKTW